MKKLFTLFFLFFAMGLVMCQNTTFSFTAKKSIDNSWVRLNKVEVTNVTKNWQQVLTYPDTTLIIIGTTGISEYAGQNEVIVLPNPFDGTTTLNMMVAEDGNLSLELFDMNGRKVVAQNFAIQQSGEYAFNISVTTPQTYILHATLNGHTTTAKLLNTGKSSCNAIEFMGMTSAQYSLKMVTNNSFSAGDQMKYVGYASFGNNEYPSETIEQIQNGSQNFTLIFSNLPTTVASVTTGEVNSINSNSANCGGEVTYDGNANVTARGVCWNTTGTPTVADAHTSDGTGIGAFVSLMSGLTPSTTYYVRAYVTNSEGTSYGGERTFTTLQAGACPATMTDQDNNVYNTVLIGTQCWMKENLRTTRFSNGTPIAPGNRTVSSTTPLYYHPAGSSSNDEIYGLLYNWVAASNSSTTGATAEPSGLQGICPTGWHLPSDAEFTTLLNYLSSQYECGGDPTKVAKAIASTDYWVSGGSECAVGYDTYTNNASGLSLVPAGVTQEEWEFDWESEWGDEILVFSDSYLGTFCYLWSATMLTQTLASALFLGYSYEKPLLVPALNWSLQDAVSVRCVKD